MWQLLTITAAGLMLLMIARARMQATVPTKPFEPNFPLPGVLEKYRAEIVAAVQEYPIDPVLLAAVVIQESGGNPEAARFEPAYEARYVAGNPMFKAALAAGWTEDQLSTSTGLTQVMGATAWATLHYHGPYSGLFDPAISLRLGAHYLKAKIDEWGNEFLALIAYNGGDGAVSKYQRGETPAAFYYAENVTSIEKLIRKGELDG